MCLVISDSFRVVSLQEKWTYERPAFLVFLFFHTLCCLPVASLTVLDHPSGIRPGGVRKVLRLGALGVPSRFGGERCARTSLRKTRWFVTLRTHARLLFRPIFSFGKHSVFSVFCG